jgi:two-component system response regulator NreC
MDAIRILLVDDNAAFLDILHRFLQQHDDLLVVGTAQSGEEGLTKAQRLKPEVIVIDLAMRGMSSLQVIPRLRTALPSLGIVVLTLWDTTVYRAAALTSGADSFVSKVAMTIDLVPAIRSAVKSNTHATTPLNPMQQANSGGIHSI